MRRCLPHLALVALLACCVTLGVVAMPPLPASCQNGQSNTLPIVDGSTAQVMRTTANGTLLSVTGSGMPLPLLVLHLYGDSYSMGHAYGELLAKEIGAMIPVVYEYFQDSFNVSQAKAQELLDFTHLATEKFTPQHHFDFMQGMSDGTNGTVAFLDIVRIAMIPEAIKAACSIIGAWGPATATGGLLQLRALDWGADGPFAQWALLTNFHPTDGFAFTSLGWTGVYGMFTGYSSSNMAIGEKVWLAYKGVQNVLGYPWTFMLQDIMQFDHDVEEALSRIASGPRTCSIWLGIGQGTRPNPIDPSLPALPSNFKLVADGYEEVHVYTPENFPTYPTHDYFPGLLWVNKHKQPSSDPCANDLMHWGYGAMTGRMVIENYAPLMQTGDQHIAMFEFDTKTMWIAHATPPPQSNPAFQNGFIEFNAETLWNTPNPYPMQAEGHQAGERIASE